MARLTERGGVAAWTPDSHDEVWGFESHLWKKNLRVFITVCWWFWLELQLLGPLPMGWSVKIKIDLSGRKIEEILSGEKKK